MRQRRKTSMTSIEVGRVRRAVERGQRRHPGCGVKPALSVELESFFVDRAAKILPARGLPLGV